MVKRITMDVHGYKVSFADRGEVWLNDNDVLYFGDALDVQAKWDGTNLVILPLTDLTGAIHIGDGTTDMNVKIFLGAAADYVEFDATNGRVNVASAEIRFASDAKLEFRDAGIFIRSHVDGRIQIQADGTTSGAIALNAGSGAGGIALWGYLLPLVTDTAGTTNGQIWMDDSEQALKYKDGLTGVPVTVALLERAQTFTQNQTFGTDWGLYFRDTGVRIYSHVDGRIRIEADGTTGNDINLHCSGTNGGISLGGYLKLFPTDTDAPASHIQCVWWDASEGVIKYRKDSGTVMTITAT